MRRLSLASKMMILAFSLVLMTSMTLIFFAYQLAYQDLVEQTAMRLKAIASSGALMVDGDLHEQIRYDKDATKPAFIQLREALRKVKKANHLKSPIYTFRKVDNRLKFVVMTNEKSFIGDSYKIKNEMRPTLESGVTHFKNVYKDEHGAWISAYAAIRNAKQDIVGILCVDIELGEFEEILYKKVKPLLIAGLVILLTGLLISWLLSRQLVRQLKYLRDVTQKISLGQMEEKISVRSKDEVGQLAESLERMRESLKVAMEMIDEDDD